MDAQTSSSAASREPSPWLLWARSETGFVRAVNEDRMGWTRTSYGDVYVISDGMGGHRGGALAAELTVSALQESLTHAVPDKDFPDKVRQAFTAANEAVHKNRKAGDPDTGEMGATAVALITNGTRFIVANVGDSRAYLWRRGSGLKRLTRDHTRVQAMVDQGLITAEQAKTHPDSSLLVRAIGHNATVDADVADWQAVAPGDIFLLCSDGLSGYVCDREISTVLRTKKGPRPISNALVERALKKGGEDNVTVQVLCYSPRGHRSSQSHSFRPTWLLYILPLLCCVVLGWTAYQQHTRLQHGDRLVRSLQTRLDTQDAKLAAATADIGKLKQRPPPAITQAPALQPVVGPPAGQKKAQVAVRDRQKKGKEQPKTVAKQNGQDNPKPTADAAAQTAPEATVTSGNEAPPHTPLD